MSLLARITSCVSHCPRLAMRLMALLHQSASSRIWNRRVNLSTGCALECVVVLRSGVLLTALYATLKTGETPEVEEITVGEVQPHDRTYCVFLM